MSNKNTDKNIESLSWETFEIFSKMMRAYIAMNKAKSGDRIEEKDFVRIFNSVQDPNAKIDVLMNLGTSIRQNKAFFQKVVEFVRCADLKVMHLVRFYRLANLNGTRYYLTFLLSPIGEEFSKTHPDELSIKTIAEAMDACDLDSDTAAFQVLSGGYLPDEEDYALFFEREHLLLKALQEKKGSWYFPEQKSLTLRILAKMPEISPETLEIAWEYALSDAKTHRPEAQAVLDNRADIVPRILDALKSGKSTTREVAARWLGRLRNPETIEPLRAALSKEKIDSARIEMLKALVASGVSLNDLLDRDELLKDAEKALKKFKFETVPPKPLEWFPFDNLPSVHWNDGSEVDPKIIRYWLVQAAKLKSPELNPMLRFYGERMNLPDRETVARFVLETWIKRDVKFGNDAEKIAILRNDPQLHMWLKTHPNVSDAELLEEFSFIFEDMKAAYSATDSKGILGIVAAWGDDTLPIVMEKYIREWYGWRVHQCRAMVIALGGMEHKSAIQALLSISRKMKTKTIREEAENAIKNIAERNDWTLDQLADRTAPTAGLNSRHEIHFSLGKRKLTARWEKEPKLTLYDESGKNLKTFPGPLKSDDETLFKEAKKTFQGTNKLLKTTITQQIERMYEAMCSGRTWTFGEWSFYVHSHPILGRVACGLIWSVLDKSDSPLPKKLFRPLEDGTLSDVEDNLFEPGEEDLIRIAHPLYLSDENVQKWLLHLDDYEIEPTFPQFARKPYVLPAELKKEKKISDFHGTKMAAFKLRSAANKFGFVRGEPRDGGWFFEYIKPMPGLDIVVVIEFSGNGLPETNLEIELYDLVFRTKSGGNIPLEKVPSVLLSEMYRNFESIT